MRYALLDFPRTIKMGPEEDHCAPAILGTVEALDPVPILSFSHRLLDNAKDLAVVLIIDEAIQGALMNQCLSRICEAMAKRKVLSNNVVEGDST
jgi:hypothetical protein